MFGEIFQCPKKKKKEIEIGFANETMCLYNNNKGKIRIFLVKNVF